MRTTIVLDESLAGKLKGLAERRSLSDFVNQCLHEHFSREEYVKKLTKLEAAYARAAAKSGSVASDFDGVAIEDWPEW